MVFDLFFCGCAGFDYCFFIVFLEVVLGVSGILFVVTFDFSALKYLKGSVSALILDMLLRDNLKCNNELQLIATHSQLLCNLPRNYTHADSCWFVLQC